MDDRLEAAIACRASVTINVLPDEELHCHAKFIAADEHGIWVQCTHAPRGVLEGLVLDRLETEASFCLEGSKYIFTTKVLKKKRDFWLTASYAIEVWLLEAPTTVTKVQRRATERFRVPDGGAIYGKLLRINPERPKETPKSMSRTMWDISAGGVSFVMPMSHKLLASDPETPFVVMLNHGGKPFILRCGLVYTRELSPHTVRFGFQFNTAEVQPAGSMELLARVLKELERRHRQRAALPLL